MSVHFTIFRLGSSADIFTHVLFDHYGPPPGFCFDITCRNTDSVVVDDKKSSEYNVEGIVIIVTIINYI